MLYCFCMTPICPAILMAPIDLRVASAQDTPNAALKEVVISASRAEQRRFDAPGAIDGVAVDPFRTASPLAEDSLG